MGDVHGHPVGDHRGGCGGVLRFLGVLVPAVSSTAWIVEPVALSDGYAVSLSAQQLVAILLIVFLTFVNTRGIKTGKRIQNVFTWTKTLALLALIVLGLAVGRAVGNFEDLWTPAGAVTTVTVTPDLPGVPAVNASEGGFALFAVFILALVGPLFSSGAWNDVSFAAAELRNPRRDLPIALVAGVVLVGILYLLTNLAYLRALPLEGIRNAADDRVATAVLDTVLGGGGAAIMAIAIMISTFGCNNGLILAGARIYYAMACDGLFFRGAGRLNRQNVPAVGLAIQGVWASLLVLPRTRSVDEAGLVQYGNLYSNLLEYVIFAVLLFYILAIIGVFVLRRTRPDAERPTGRSAIPWCRPSILSGRASWCWPCWSTARRRPGPGCCWCWPASRSISSGRRADLPCPDVTQTWPQPLPPSLCAWGQLFVNGSVMATAATTCARTCSRAWWSASSPCRSPWPWRSPRGSRPSTGSTPPSSPAP